MSAAAGTLYLVPVSFADADPASVIPPATLVRLRGLHCFIAEDPKSARRFLKAAGHPRPLQELRIATLDEHTGQGELAPLLSPLLAGEDCGLMSEAGCPAVADPGAELVRLAHARGIRVVPLVGPSAILLALMASGGNGQRFTFHGYLPVESAQRGHRLRELDNDAGRSGATQIFMETPYRNGAMVQAILDNCRGDTMLCVATDLTLSGESVVTRTIAAWKKKPPAPARRPTVYLLYREIR